MYNKTVLIGRLGADPEIRYTAQQKAIANLSVATTETWRDKSDKRQERTEWHRVVLFGKLAEIARDHLKSGALVLLEGPSRTRKWQDNSGADRYTTEIHADVLRMLGSKSDKATSGPAPSSTPSDAYAGYDDFDNEEPF
ncbi:MULTISPECIES: single-stranded DNA-binding protein [unclassified Methylobacter]|uniref:single-stranded DNA-binding protein n=1 Tax=unclassified Methylobacter TaxID=2635283 RepID=UPI0018938795|nr:MULTISPECIES: single-stranded DNA-binding protein [unclassified Methylobacter]MBF6650029.1 single-stranded DNA-binding protein [Methylobacter sp. BlB1]WAK04375.1 single-stranded DNA-binding protein [Methylobacter sp. YRD-M1]